MFPLVNCGYKLVFIMFTVVEKDCIADGSKPKSNSIYVIQKILKTDLLWKPEIFLVGLLDKEMKKNKPEFRNSINAGFSAQGQFIKTFGGTVVLHKNPGLLQVTTLFLMNR